MPRKPEVRFSYHIAQTICRRVAAGESVQRICCARDMPDSKTVSGWRVTHPEFGESLAAARRAAGIKPQTPNAEKWRFYNEVVLPYDSDDCLEWPFSTTGSRGYGVIYPRSGVAIYISRLVCERTHGPPPTPKHEAAHTCGRGKFGCVSPRHIVWKTVQENNWDKDIHGTRIWGAKHPDAKLTPEQVLEIRTRSAEKRRDLAKEYGVGPSTIQSIISGQTWSRL